MKRLIFILATCCLCFQAKADHITGGEIFYTYLGRSGTDHTYRVTVKLFMRCFSGRQFNNPTIVSIFDRNTNQRLQDISVPLTSQEQLNMNNTNPCISNPPLVCYDVGYYEFNLTLPESSSGYLIATQVNYRIAGISNLVPNYSQVGATYTTEIPGTAQHLNNPENNSARFVGSDLVIVCAGNAFSYSFAANDPDNDELRYSFCGAYKNSNTGLIAPPLNPPYEEVPYGNGYTGNSPLGMNVSLNTQTGLITGIAPPGGVYVVTVCVEEIRNGQVIAIHRKDLQIRITECTIAAASLENEYTLCKESTSISISNLSTSPLITSQTWQLVNPQGNIISISTDPQFQYNFPDTGIYHIRLYINQGQMCPDSTSSPIKVYPGLVTDFNFAGQCLNKNIQFSDASYTPYGNVNSWKWEFGSGSSPASSNIKDPVTSYFTLGSKTPQLIITTTKGCRDTFSKLLQILDKPPISLAFKDTLICKGDSVQLAASGNGSFSWTPVYQIMQAGTANPVVKPEQTTRYYVELNDQGCFNNDSLTVRVVSEVTLQMKPDTTICLGDSLVLGATTDALQFLWSPAAYIANPLVLQAIAFPAAPSTFQLTATIGGCSATGTYFVNTVPYPSVNAGPDTTICYGTATQLTGATNGSSFSWSPAAANSLNPVVKPFATTAYVLTAFDNIGCPKPARDTVVITVLPKILASAGKDTAVILNQPLQLMATGGSSYSWSPANFLSATAIPDPIALVDYPVDQVRYKVLVYDEAGCFDSAFINVRIFTTGPTVFVPNAFTPNGDGRNDVLRPVAVGMTRIEYFRVFNRWGQLVFSTTVNGQGWDGRINGMEQKSDSYVWEVKATDFHGKPFFSKGVVTLIR